MLQKVTPWESANGIAGRCELACAGDARHTPLSCFPFRNLRFCPFRAIYPLVSLLLQLCSSAHSGSICGKYLGKAMEVFMQFFNACSPFRNELNGCGFQPQLPSHMIRRSPRCRSCPQLQRRIAALACSCHRTLLQLHIPSDGHEIVKLQSEHLFSYNLWLQL